MRARTHLLRWSGEHGLLDAFLLWIPIAAALTVVALLVYGVAQDNLRQSANDPQIQMAENAAAALAAGQAPDAVLPGRPVDLAANLAPFVIVYGTMGDIRASSAALNGAVPALPPGVLNSVPRRGEDRLTWQPQPGVRIAAVVVAYGGSQPGYVLAGRSLRLVEQREDGLLGDVVAGLVAGLIVTLAAAIVVASARRPLQRLFANS